MTAYARSTELSYGIIIGFNKTEEDLFNPCYEDDIVNPFIKLDDVYVVDDEVLEKHHSARLDSIARFCEILNKASHVLITYHNGHKDNGCEYNGHHWHILADLRVHPTTSARWGKDIIQMGHATKAVYIKSQVAISPTDLAKHILKAPRQFVLAKGRYEDLKETIEEMHGEIPVSQPNWQKCGLKEDWQYERMVNLTKLMKKYRTPDINILKARIKGHSEEDWKTYLQLMSLTSWDLLVKKAIELYKTEDKAMKFYDRFGTDTETEEYHSLEDTIKIFDKWFIHQNISKEEFINKFKQVLNKELPKVNTFYLVGEASSGKSWIVRSIQPYYTYMGECNGGDAQKSSFIWQPMVDASLGMMEECFITQAMVDQAKLVLEGSPTMVNIKGKAHQMLERTPIIITSNQDPWLYCSSARQPLMDRMHYFNTRRMEELKDYKKKPHPNIWHLLFYVEKELKMDRYVVATRQLATTALTQEYKTKKTTQEIIEWMEQHKYERGIAYTAHSRALFELRDNTGQPNELPTICSQDLFSQDICLDPTEQGQKIISRQEYEDIIKTQMAATPDTVYIEDSQDFIVPDTPPEKRRKL
nr:MAG: non-structural protein NS1 [Pot worm parvo-like virus 2]